MRRPMAKNFYLRDDQIKPLATGHGACIASDMITVEGMKVGYMYRQKPRYPEDSGWVFLSGVERQELLDNPAKSDIFDVNTIANYDPEIIPFLDAPIGSALVRDPDSGRFEPDFGPEGLLDQDEPIAGDLPAGAIASPNDADALSIQQTQLDPDPIPEFCDQCGIPLDPDEVQIRLKTDTMVAGAAAFHRTVHLALCPACADTRDGTSSRMIYAMAAFVAVAALLVVGGWIVSAIFR